jgi:hypothetical protein
VICPSSDKTEITRWFSPDRIVRENQEKQVRCEARETYLKPVSSIAVSKAKKYADKKSHRGISSVTQRSVWCQCASWHDIKGDTRIAYVVQPIKLSTRSTNSQIPNPLRSRLSRVIADVSELTRQQVGHVERMDRGKPNYITFARVRDSSQNLDGNW